MIAENNKLHNFFDNQNTLNLNSGAIHIENTLGIKQRLAWLFLVWKAIPILKNYSDNDLDNTVVKIKVNLAEIKNSIKYDSTNNEYLKEILENLLTTKVAKASPSTSSAMIDNGRPCLATASKTEIMSFIEEIFLS